MMCRIASALSKYVRFMLQRKPVTQEIGQCQGEGGISFTIHPTVNKKQLKPAYHAQATVITPPCPRGRSAVAGIAASSKHSSPTHVAAGSHLHRRQTSVTCHLHTRSKATMSRADVSLADYDAIGFDIDHTLATYNVPNLNALLHESFTRYLVDKKGYPEELLKPFHHYADFCVRGLVFDVRHGNHLKIAKDGTILRASHGTTFLSPEKIASIYKDQHWEPTDKLVNRVDNMDGVFIFDNFFDIIGTVILARVVDIVDKTAEDPIHDYTEHFKHVKDAYEDAFNPGGFSGGTGGLFPQLVKNASLYINTCSESTKAWFKQLRNKGKTVFFMSSSHIDFATFSLKHIFGDDFMDYFDIGVVRAKKPSFFDAKRPFLKLDGYVEKGPTEEIKAGKVYSQGNIEALNKFISKTTNKQSPKVLYFGDSIRSDISPSHQHAGWDTVFVLGELEGELNEVEESNGQPMAKRTKANETQYPPGGYVPNSPWGSFYTDTLRNTNGHPPADTDTDRLNTLWGHLINKYSTLVIPSVTHITGLPLEHSFKVFDSAKSDQWGFYPSHPRSLNGTKH